MKKYRSLSNCAALALMLSVGCVAAAHADREALLLPYSNDAAVRAVQQQVYETVHAYERALNSGDTKAIVDLFADNGFAEWNDKRTYATRQQKVDGYDALFKTAKFSTVFAYDSVSVYGDTAIVRTHHHRGAAVIEGGKSVIDRNREVFVLHKVDGRWKIVLYTFNTDPVQGEG